MRQIQSWLLVASAAVALAGCGGGGGGGGDAGAPPGAADPLVVVPGEATQSVSAWIGYLTMLVMSTDADERQPAAFSDGAPSTLPAAEQDEPAAL